jgi:hypothetical protein
VHEEEDVMAKKQLVASIVLLVSAAGAHAQFFLQSFESTATNFGWSMADAGDVNADGFADVIVGSYLGQSVQVFSGKDGSELYSFASANPHWVFGYSVSGVGDVNGDGFDDVLIGAADECCVGFAGGAFVMSGKDGVNLYAYNGAVDEGFGYRVAGVGDVNADGRPDFAVSAYSNSTNGLYAGKVIVYSGRTGGVLHTFFGDGAMDFFGNWMSGAGDVNHDGHGDIIVGEYNFSGTLALGGVRVLSGSTGAILYDYQGTAIDPIGFGVDGVGDIDKDLFDDFMYLASDRVVVRSGKTGAVLLTLSEYQIGAACSIAGTGDVTGDGFPDIIVGNVLRDDGLPGGGHATLFSGKDGSPVYEFPDGGTIGEYVGQSVSGGGDIDGDGVKDFLITRFGSKLVDAYAGLLPPASWENYDEGWPGTLGVPALTLDWAPILCATIHLNLGNSRGVATHAFLLKGMAAAHLPTPFDGFFLVLSPTMLSLFLPPAGLSLRAKLPCDPAFSGFTLYLQVLEFDPGASKGISFSAGLKMIF